MEIKLEKIEERWHKNRTFAIANFFISEGKDWSIVNILISHEMWRRKTNKVSLGGLLEYLEKNGKNFIQRKIKEKEIKLNDENDSDYVIATEKYTPQKNEILISFQDFNN